MRTKPMVRARANTRQLTRPGPNGPPLGKETLASGVRRVELERVQRSPAVVILEARQIGRRCASSVDQQHFRGNGLVRRAWRNNTFGNDDLEVFRSHADGVELLA